MKRANGSYPPALVGRISVYSEMIRRVIGNLMSRFWGVLLVGIIWQAWVTIGDVDKIVMPRPAAVLFDLVSNADAYLPHLMSTIKVATLGITLGMGGGVLLATAAWYSPLLRGLTTPPALLAQSVPVVAMIPVIVRVLGYGDWSVAAVAGIIVFFPTFVFVSAGLRTIPSGAEDVFFALRSNTLRRFRYLALPAAVPSLVLALRISVATAILGALVAEWLTGSRGLGVLLAITTAELRAETVWGVAIVGTALAVTAFILASKLENATRDRWM